MNEPLGYPRKAMIEPTRSCNIKCPACPVGNGAAKKFPEMKLSTYKRIIDNISGFIESLSLFNYGEPLLHPEITEFIKYAKDSGIASVRIHSNGLLLNNRMAESLIAARLDLIRISVDGIDQKTYGTYRVGGNFQTLIDNIENFVKIRDKAGSAAPRIEAQCIVMSHNEDTLAEFRNMFENIGVDSIRYKTFNAGMGWDLDKELQFLAKKDYLSRYEDRLAKRVKKVCDRSVCPWPRKVIVINCDTTVVPCCYDYNNENGLGSVGHGNFADWWDTSPRREFINSLAIDYRSIAMCRNCQRGIMDIPQQKK